jgi:hypothetical protein
MYSLREIKSEVDRFAKKIRAPESLLPTYGHTRDAARPHIEVDARGYHYVIVERGVSGFSNAVVSPSDQASVHAFPHLGRNGTERAGKNLKATSV